MDVVAIRYPAPETGEVIRVKRAGNVFTAYPVYDGAEDRTLGLAAVASFCRNPGCACMDVDLKVFRLDEHDDDAAFRDGELVTRRPIDRPIQRQGRLCKLEVGSGRLFAADPATPEGLQPLDDTADAFFKRCLGGGPLSTLLVSAFREGRGWGRHDRYRTADWSKVDPGAMVHWDEAFDDEPPTFIEADSVLVSDAYCVDAKCDCTEAVLACAAERGGGGSAHVRLDLRTGDHHLTDVHGMDPMKVGAWVDIHVKRIGGLEAMRRRDRRMKEEVGTFLKRQWERKAVVPLPEASVRSGPKVGRNDPCPCGSGKKYKKCCGA